MPLEPLLERLQRWPQHGAVVAYEDALPAAAELVAGHAAAVVELVVAAVGLAADYAELEDEVAVDDVEQLLAGVRQCLVPLPRRLLHFRSSLDQSLQLLFRCKKN